MGANKEYKNTVFTELFSDAEKLIELYNAISGSSYGADTSIEINTLADILFMDMMNDISFTIGEKTVILLSQWAVATFPNKSRYGGVEHDSNRVQDGRCYRSMERRGS